MSYRGQSIVTFEAATTPIQLLAPVELMDTGRVNVNDAGFTTLDVAASVPEGATALLVEFSIQVSAGTSNALSFRGRGVGLTTGGLNADGSQAVFAPTNGYYYSRAMWLPTNAAREFQYQRVNPNLVDTFWQIHVLGYQ